MSDPRFPGWRYHLTDRAVIVHSAAEAAALGPDWRESPADCGHEPTPEPVPDPDRLTVPPTRGRGRPKKVVHGV